MSMMLFPMICYKDCGNEAHHLLDRYDSDDQKVLDLRELLFIEAAIGERHAGLCRRSESGRRAF